MLLDITGFSEHFCVFGVLSVPRRLPELGVPTGDGVWLGGLLFKFHARIGMRVTHLITRRMLVPVSASTFKT